MNKLRKKISKFALVTFLCSTLLSDTTLKSFAAEANPQSSTMTEASVQTDRPLPTPIPLLIKGNNEALSIQTLSMLPAPTPTPMMDTASNQAISVQEASSNVAPAPTPSPLHSNEALSSQSLPTNQAPSATPFPVKLKESGQDFVPNRYIITFKSWEAHIKGKNKITSKKGKIKNHFDKLNAYAVELDADAVNTLKNDLDVQLVEPDFIVHNQSDEIPWGIEDVHAPIAQSSGLYGNGVKVAILDTGISPHQDLSIQNGISFVDGVSSTIDDNGHGTHVAGTVAAQINQTGILGIAPKVELYPVKVLGSDGSGSYSSIIAAIDWAIDNKINIINMSFGSINYSAALENAIKLAYANNILIIASTGNNGNGTAEDTVTYPAKFSEVIGVGAVDINNNHAYFSSVGTEVELVAPGVNINSTTNNGAYGVKSGTSMAAPHVVGVAALLWGKNLALSNNTIRGLLNQSALDLGDATIYGNGLVDASYALEIYDTYTKHDEHSKNKGEKHKKDRKNDTSSSVSTNATASFTASNVTSSSITWNAVFPVSGQWGSRVETYNSMVGEMLAAPCIQPMVLIHHTV